MHRFAERIIKMGFSAQNQCKIVHRIIAVVHEHLDIIQDSRTQVLGFVSGEKQRLVFFPVEIGDLLLNGLEIIQTVSHFCEVSGNEVSLFLQLLLGKGG